MILFQLMNIYHFHFNTVTYHPVKIKGNLTKEPKIQILRNLWRFGAWFRLISQIYHKRTHLLENWVMWLIHWLLELFAKKCVFWTSRWLLGWISVKLSSIWSKMHLQQDSLPFLPPASCFRTFWLEHSQKSIFGIFFRLSFSFCCSD